MSNEKNLIPFNKLTKDEQRKIASKGGKASVEARRKKKLMKETAESILSMPMGEGEFKSVDELNNYLACKGKNLSIQELIVLQQVKKALDGDLKAAEFLRDLVGEKPLNDW